MRKIYHYKDGSKAVFEQDTKIVFTKEEYNALIADDYSKLGMPITTTPLYDYIESKVSRSVFCQARFSDILDCFRQNRYRTESFIYDDVEGCITYENDIPCVIQANPPDGAFVLKGSKEFNDTLEILKENYVIS